MNNSDNLKHMNSFPLLLDELSRRFKSPSGQVSFWVFLLLGLLIFSACGVWVELGKYCLPSGKTLEGIQTAIYTFIPAIACPASMQLIYSDNDKKYLRSAGLFVGFVLLLLAIGLLAFNEHLSPVFSIIVGVFLSVISILTWWVANGLDLTFYDNPSPDATTGGNPLTPVPGNTNGFKTK